MKQNRGDLGDDLGLGGLDLDRGGNGLGSSRLSMDVHREKRGE
jgi:hypothetical protein